MPLKFTSPRTLTLCLVTLLSFSSLTGCDFLESFVPRKGETTDVIDRQQDLTVGDFRDLNNADKLKEDTKQDVTATAELGAPPMPDLAQVLAAPKPPKVANTKLVTLAVTEDVPLRDVLFELGRLAKVDIEVGSGLDTTGINLRATDRPFNEVIERIAHLANLRYSVAGNSIRVERDTPYIKNYSLDFLNIVRSSMSGYNLSTNILSGGGGGSSSGGSSSGGGSGGSSSSGGGASGVGTSGSTSSITSQAESDLWSALEASIGEILSYKANGAASGDAAAPAADAAAGSAAAGTAASGMVINRQAGVLSVNGTDAQHEMVARFLTLMSRNSSAQVLIEAKIVEVALNDQFLSGINWTKLIGDVGKTNVSIGNYQPTGITSGGSSLSLGSGVTSPALTLGIEGGDLDAVLSMTQRFGTTRTLSSPRLSATNNQQAVLTFARNSVFFDCTVTASTTTSTVGGTSNTSDPTVDCSQNTVPIGVILSILPSVNLDTQEVTLNVRPTLTRQVDTAENPEGAYIESVIRKNSTTGSTIAVPKLLVPVIQVRELDSVMKVKSGGVMVIGGLMQDETRADSTGIPGMQELPIFGNLFKGRSEDSTKSELIIFIKATIINPDGSAHAVDKAIYEKYVTDPRPLFPKGN